MSITDVGGLGQRALARRLLCLGRSIVGCSQERLLRTLCRQMPFYDSPPLTGIRSADIYGLIRFGRFRPWNDWPSFDAHVVCLLRAYP